MNQINLFAPIMDWYEDVRQKYLWPDHFNKVQETVASIFHNTLQKHSKIDVIGVSPYDFSNGCLPIQLINKYTNKISSIKAFDISAESLRQLQNEVQTKMKCSFSYQQYDLTECNLNTLYDSLKQGIKKGLNIESAFTLIEYFINNTFSFKSSAHYHGEYAFSFFVHSATFIPISFLLKGTYGLSIAYEARLYDLIRLWNTVVFKQNLIDWFNQVKNEDAKYYLFIDYDKNFFVKGKEQERVEDPKRTYIDFDERSIAEGIFTSKLLNTWNWYDDVDHFHRVKVIEFSRK